MAHFYAVTHANGSPYKLSQASYYVDAEQMTGGGTRQDRLFAEVTLDKDEFALYDNVYQHLTLNAPTPDLVIYLQAPVAVLQERIQRRGISHEQPITGDYLERLNDAYARFFHFYDDAPLLIVNATDIDLVNNDRDFQQLVDHALDIRSGRHYFNPRPLAG